MTKIKDLKNLSREDLSAKLKEDKARILELRMKSYQSRLKNVKEVRSIRKDIARILTLLNQKN
ncbi:50S ribosomal protein L29 [Candidatus Giovannonibacteria bacterium]|nr:50S ribosomal protein L29 [Candidatus Giovannonibacteria bacterium]